MVDGSADQAYDIDRLSAIATELYRSERYADALLLYRIAADCRPNHPQLLWNIGVTHMALQDWCKATRVFRELHRLDSSEKVMTNLAHAMQKCIDSDSAQPKSLSLYHGAITLGTARLRSFQYEDAICLFSEHIGRSRVIFDIGSNEGLLSEYFAGCDGDHIIHAFEPHPETFVRLGQRIDKAGFDQRVVRHNLALGDEAADDVPLFEAGAGFGLARLDGTHPVLGIDWKTRFTIRVRRLDDLDLPLPDFMKVDVEDHEVQVFRGAERILRQAKPHIAFENWYYPFDRDANLSPIRFLMDLGYQIYAPIWRTTDSSGNAHWDINGPGQPIEAYTLYLNPMPLKERRAYDGNMSLFAIHPDRRAEIVP